MDSIRTVALKALEDPDDLTRGERARLGAYVLDHADHVQEHEALATARRRPASPGSASLTERLAPLAPAAALTHETGDASAEAATHAADADVETEA